MKKLSKSRVSTIIILLLLIVFGILYIIFDTNLFNNDKRVSFNEAVSRQQNKGVLNMKEDHGEFKKANENDIKKAMSIHHGDNKLKYMDISEKVPMSKEEVNKMLKGKGILENQGQSFIDAQDKYEVNIIYLISHAIVETGNGDSELAHGIKDGKHNYYNFYGIGAFDENAVHTGKSYAKKEDWTSPRKAILGGAKFVRNQYFENQQISLYQMRWNPKTPGQNQYASDIHWADNIAKIMKKYYEQFGIKKDKVRKDYYI
ncbi:N-acetylglucosaminidase [Staphylococcus warneri]|uniref:Autolysin n=2 Tax=Staphylococcus warneri TaxID=1292 RepID=A0A364URX0_STAWA|nr:MULTISPECIES: N-acetylglucosaminidase [Staphylococcus]MBJ7884049.1 N-acetylglucosaminidase [Bacillaceae bacterium HSR45]PAK72755.1 autolysin [Staphylococcus pasteuri]SKR87380.1 AtlE [Mycobacteroides abscessus subsp. abscessus]AGC89926.1 putative N-acetylmuramoyl-L-alanine amidase [Staphylococcus warneri SG1]AXZ22759.1 autolysin [Staphylococcus warneri]